jgi:hypothetical protein
MRASLAAVSAWLLACGMPPPPMTPPDDVATDDAGVRAAVALDLSIGTGARGAFVPARSGSLLLQRGCQGSQHIFTSVRLVGAATGLVRVKVTVVRLDDGMVVSVPIDVRLRPDQDPLSDAAGLLTGLTPVIEVPRDVLMRDVEVRVEVTDEAGSRAAGVMRGKVTWGPDSCGAHG